MAAALLVFVGVPLWWLLIPRFFVAAVIVGVHERLRGGDPTAFSAIGYALPKFFHVLVWALVSIPTRNEHHRSLYGQFKDAIDIVCGHVVVLEGRWGFAAARRAGDLITGRWGKGARRRARLATWPRALFLLPPLAFLAYLLCTIIYPAALPIPGWWLRGATVAAAWVAVYIYVGSVLKAVYRTAIYYYAVHAMAPPWGPFTEERLVGSYRRREQ